MLAFLLVLVLVIMSIVIACHSHRLMMYLLFNDSTHDIIYRPSSSHCILYFHGLGQANDEHLSMVTGCAVKWFVYSNNPLEDLKARAVATFDELEKGYGQGNVSVYGFSLGAYLATHVASVREPRVLLLEAPMASLECSVRKMMGLASLLVPGRPHAQTMEIEDMLARRVRMPTYVLSSRTDEVVCFQERYPSHVHHRIIESPHNAIHAKPEWLEWLREAGLLAPERPAKSLFE